MHRWVDNWARQSIDRERFILYASLSIFTLNRVKTLAIVFFRPSWRKRVIAQRIEKQPSGSIANYTMVDTRHRFAIEGVAEGEVSKMGNMQNISIDPLAFFDLSYCWKDLCNDSFRYDPTRTIDSQSMLVIVAADSLTWEAHLYLHHAYMRKTCHLAILIIKEFGTIRVIFAYYFKGKATHLYRTTLLFKDCFIFVMALLAIISFWRAFKFPLSFAVMCYSVSNHF